MTDLTSNEVHLVRRPQGEPTLDDFAIVGRTVPEPGEGEVVVANHYMSVDPYMRGRMNDVKSYVPPFQLNEAMQGGAVGEVIASNSPDRAEGDFVVHGLGWRQHAVMPAKHTQPIPAAEVPLSAYLGVLGMTGLTAYVGLTKIAEMKEGDIVFVSGAAGAVGSVVAQIAANRGAAAVIGSAGSAEKVQFLTDQLGLDAAFNYHDGSPTELLADLAPKGIDVYFDNVGGDHLEAAIHSMRPFGRIAMCGAISQYNATSPVPGPSNLMMAVGKRLKMQGFIVSDHNDVQPEFIAEAGPWLQEGKLRHDETVVQGIENAAQAFIDMLDGANTGKMIVAITPTA